MMRSPNVVLAAGLACAMVLPAGAADWPVFGHDPARSGYDAGDPVLSARNVGRLRVRWRTLLGGTVAGFVLAGLYAPRC